MQIRGLLLLMGAAGALGAMHVLEKRGIALGARPAAFALARTASALVVMLCVWAVLRPDPVRRVLQGRVVLRLALVGALASGLVLLLSLWALGTTGATHKGTIQALYPLATVAFVWLLYDQAPRRRTGTALLLIVGGLVLLTSRGFSEPPRTGDLLLLLTVPVIGFTDAYAKRALEGISPITLTVGRYAFGLVVVSGAFLFLEGGVLLTSAESWRWALLAGVAGGLGVTALYAGIDRWGPTRAALVVAGAPLVTLLLEGLLLGAWVEPLGAIGVLLVLLGIARASISGSG